jgi:hypothetical protein
MKYLWSWEWKLEDREKEEKIAARFNDAVKENPRQFPKMLTNTCFTGRCKGFRIIEADTEEQLANLIAMWWPTEDWKLEVILEGQSPVFSKAFQKWSQM